MHFMVGGPPSRTEETVVPTTPGKRFASRALIAILLMIVVLSKTFGNDRLREWLYSNTVKWLGVAIMVLALLWFTVWAKRQRQR
ncbi:MAG TPA: hypothetical protein VIL85_11665 [Thermomicrobiales bacterium]|jgi:uncharacterized membrane protein YkvI